LRGAAAARTVWVILFAVAGQLLLDGVSAPAGGIGSERWANAADHHFDRALVRRMAQRPPPGDVFEDLLRGLLRGVLP
jgi:hypothetical protein